MAHDLARTAGKIGTATSENGTATSKSTVYRILVRHGLIERRSRRRNYQRWEREAPMALWQIDIVGGVFLVDGTQCKVVTGVDDHSRFCVIAAVVPRATGRAVCLAFAEALRRYGVPDEVLTDNGKQFTDRFGKGGEVLFDRICRDNAITHRLTEPSSPTTTGKVERFHGSLRREFLNHAEPFDSVLAAQAAVDTWVTGYNCDRPHQALDMGYPAERFAPRQQARGGSHRTGRRGLADRRGRRPLGQGGVGRVGIHRLCRVDENDSRSSLEGAQGNHPLSPPHLADFYVF